MKFQYISTVEFVTIKKKYVPFFNNSKVKDQRFKNVLKLTYLFD